MAHLLPRRLVNDRSETLLELLYSDYSATDFPEHNLRPNLPGSGLYAPQDRQFNYQGAMDTLEFSGNSWEHYNAFPHPHIQCSHAIDPVSLVTPAAYARVLGDQHIIPVPGAPSVPCFSINNATPAAGVQMPGTRASLDPSRADGYPPTGPSSYHHSLVSYSGDGYRWKQPLGLGYRPDANSFHPSPINSALALDHEDAPKNPYNSLQVQISQKSTTHPSPVISAPEASPRSAIPVRSSKGNRFNTRFREQADAATAGAPSLLPSHRRATMASSPTSSMGPSQSSKPRAERRDDDPGVDIPPPFIKERTTFPGKQYKCRWGLCRQVLVPCPLEGEHPSNTQERFQDAIERHIEDHVWISACGRMGKLKWDCRWNGDCDAILGSKRALIRHVGAHSGFRVLCDECGSSYSRFDIFRRHQRKCGGDHTK